MNLLEADVAPPYGPWATLGLAVLLGTLARYLVHVIVRAYDAGATHRKNHGPRPPWYRIRVLGYHGLTLVPQVFAAAFCAAAMVFCAVYLWTELNILGVLCGLSGFAGSGCFLWSLFDSFRPRAWRNDGKEEYSYLDGAQFR